MKTGKHNHNEGESMGGGVGFSTYEKQKKQKKQKNKGKENEKSNSVPSSSSHMTKTIVTNSGFPQKSYGSIAHESGSKRTEAFEQLLVQSLLTGQRNPWYDVLIPYILSGLVTTPTVLGYWRPSEEYGLGELHHAPFLYKQFLGGSFGSFSVIINWFLGTSWLNETYRNNRDIFRMSNYLRHLTHDPEQKWKFISKKAGLLGAGAASATLIASLIFRSKLGLFPQLVVFATSVIVLGAMNATGLDKLFKSLYMPRCLKGPLYGWNQQQIASMVTAEKIKSMFIETLKKAITEIKSVKLPERKDKYYKLYKTMSSAQQNQSRKEALDFFLTIFEKGKQKFDSDPRKTVTDVVRDTTNQIGAAAAVYSLSGYATNSIKLILGIGIPLLISSVTGLGFSFPFMALAFYSGVKVTNAIFNYIYELVKERTVNLPVGMDHYLPFAIAMMATLGVCAAFSYGTTLILNKGFVPLVEKFLKALGISNKYTNEIAEIFTDVSSIFGSAAFNFAPVGEGLDTVFLAISRAIQKVTFYMYAADNDIEVGDNDEERAEEIGEAVLGFDGSLPAANTITKSNYTTWQHGNSDAQLFTLLYQAVFLFEQMSPRAVVEFLTIYDSEKIKVFLGGEMTSNDLLAMIGAIQKPRGFFTNTARRQESELTATAKSVFNGAGIYPNEDSPEIKETFTDFSRLYHYHLSEILQIKDARKTKVKKAITSGTSFAVKFFDKNGKRKNLPEESGHRLLAVNTKRNDDEGEVQMSTPLLDSTSRPSKTFARNCRCVLY